MKNVLLSVLIKQRKGGVYNMVAIKLQPKSWSLLLEQNDNFYAVTVIHTRSGNQEIKKCLDTAQDLNCIDMKKPFYMTQDIIEVGVNESVRYLPELKEPKPINQNEEADMPSKSKTKTTKKTVTKKARVPKAYEGVTKGKKRCSRCGKALPLSSFHKNSNMKDGLLNHCRDCEAAYQKARREKKAGTKKVAKKSTKKVNRKSSTKKATKKTAARKSKKK